VLLFWRMMVHSAPLAGVPSWGLDALASALHCGQRTFRRV
jgi:hypothetical protein